MRIHFGIGVGMMNPVHDAIHARAHIGGALCYIGKNKKETFPSPAHAKGPVCRIPMMKKRLCKKRQIPMCNKKNKNDRHDACNVLSVIYEGAKIV